MITINIDPILFSLGPLSVRWYGLMYIVGIVIGLLVALPYGKARGLKMEHLEQIVIWSVPAGLIGARLYYVIQQPLEQYVEEPWRIFAFWEGGMAFFGAIFAVVIVILVLTWRMKLPIWKFLDVAVIFAVVGQFFGRIGNIINGDVLGYPTGLPWGFIYAHPNSFAPQHNIAYQPAAVYEALINIVLFVVLWKLRNKFRAGVIFFIYILGYSLSQFLIFFVRDNEVIILGLKQAQLTSIATIIVTVIGFYFFLKYQRRHAITS
jgi:phosphatidylglycerol---prolipoprotein diacylglyceryl transferase